MNRIIVMPNGRRAIVTCLLMSVGMQADSFKEGDPVKQNAARSAIGFWARTLRAYDKVGR